MCRCGPLHPDPGFAGPIGLSNLASVTGRGIRAVIKKGRTTRSGNVAVADNSSAGPTTSRGDLDVFYDSSITGITGFLGMLDNDDPGTYAGTAHRGDGFAVLADDLRDEARAALASHGTRPSGDRERGWTHEQSERSSDGAGRSSGSNGIVGGGTGVPTTVPEPNTLTLLGAGLVGAVMWTRKRIGGGRP